MASGLSQVFLTTDIDNVPMKIDVSINCGLILSEVLSNCLKYAFQGLEDGEVAVVSQDGILRCDSTYRAR